MILIIHNHFIEKQGHNLVKIEKKLFAKICVNILLQLKYKKIPIDLTSNKHFIQGVKNKKSQNNFHIFKMAHSRISTKVC